MPDSSYSSYFSYSSSSPSSSCCYPSTRCCQFRDTHELDVWIPVGEGGLGAMFKLVLLAEDANGSMLAASVCDGKAAAWAVGVPMGMPWVDASVGAKATAAARAKVCRGAVFGAVAAYLLHSQQRRAVFVASREPLSTEVAAGLAGGGGEGGSRTRLVEGIPLMQDFLED